MFFIFEEFLRVFFEKKKQLSVVYVLMD